MRRRWPGRGADPHPLIVIGFAPATDAGAHKVYWLTQSGNATARRLYDSLATDTGFVYYQMEL